MKEVIPVHCPKCGSWKWYEQGQVNNGGYSFKKGIIGTVVMGPIGAVAGINGKKSIVYYCQNCGFTRSYNK